MVPITLVFQDEVLHKSKQTNKKLSVQSGRIHISLSTIKAEVEFYIPEITSCSPSTKFCFLVGYSGQKLSPLLECLEIA